MQFVDEVTSLGVVLDSTLSWGPQVNHITNKVDRALFGVKFIRSCTTLTLRKRLVESLVIPHLDYCSVAYLDASSSLRSRLQRFANAGVRFIFSFLESVRTHESHHISVNLGGCAMTPDGITLPCS